MRDAARAGDGGENGYGWLPYGLGGSGLNI